jgi:rhodanese-related sulfurtransferase
MNSEQTPEIAVKALAEKLKSQDKFVLLDVREDWELDLAKIKDSRLQILAMSQLAREGLKALPDPLKTHEAEIYVICHHGVRSADVTRWLVSNGWMNVFSVAGGIDEYARSVDRSVGVY